MAFYYVWFKKIDRLLNDMISRDLYVPLSLAATSLFISSSSRINDAVSLLQLYGVVHPDSKVATYDFHDSNAQHLIAVICPVRSLERAISSATSFPRRSSTMKLDCPTCSAKPSVSTSARVSTLRRIDNRSGCTPTSSSAPWTCFSLARPFVHRCSRVSDRRVFTTHTQIIAHHGSHERSRRRTQIDQQRREASQTTSDHSAMLQSHRQISHCHDEAW